MFQSFSLSAFPFGGASVPRVGFHFCFLISQFQRLDLSAFHLPLHWMFGVRRSMFPNFSFFPSLPAPCSLLLAPCSPLFIQCSMFHLLTIRVHPWLEIFVPFFTAFPISAFFFALFVVKFPSHERHRPRPLPPCPHRHF